MKQHNPRRQPNQGCGLGLRAYTYGQLFSQA
jgi:hypothetical protein